MTDQHLIDLIREGRDEAAFKALYKHLSMVERSVRANNGNRADARDVFQDALIIFHRRVREDGFVLTCTIGTYLFAICRNLWREELRRRDRSISNWPLPEVDTHALDLAAHLAREADYLQAEQALGSIGGH